MDRAVEDERTLRAQAELIELAPEAIMVREIGSGIIRFWSRGATELYGWQPDEAVGRVANELLETTFPRPLDQIESELVQRGHWEGELSHTQRDGSRIVVASRWALQRDEHGQAVAHLEVNSDITDQKRFVDEQSRLLRQAEAAEARFRGLLESAPDAIVISDSHGRVQIVNRQTEVLFAYERVELLGQPVEMLLPERLRPGHEGHRTEYVAQPRTRPMGAGLELFGRRKDGIEFPVEISLSPMQSDGELLVTAVIRDVTERKRAEEQLKTIAADLARSNAELEQFAYVASHDLQEPLRMVASYTQLLKRRYATKLDHDADEFIDFAVDGARRMQELINDLLAYSRVGTRALHLETVDVGALVDGIVGDLTFALEESGGIITHGELPTVRADAIQLRQLFQNVLANAIKFCGDRPPEVRVTSEADRDELRFTVQDSGIGIEPQYLDRIFVLFQRLHTRADYPGTGIGLAICKKIVERHGGRIWVESELGRGTSIHFTLAPKVKASPR
jgi:PAS domain S-box-containing protein